MPFKPFDPTDSVADEFAAPPSKKEPGTVLKPFNGPTRRFAIDYVVVESDMADMPMSLDDLRAGGFIA